MMRASANPTLASRSSEARARRDLVLADRLMAGGRDGRAGCGLLAVLDRRRRRRWRPRAARLRPLGGDLLVGPDRGARAELLAAVQDQAVDDEEHPGQDRLAEQDPEGVLGDQADQPDRDGGQDDHPGQPLVPGRDPRVPPLPVAQRGEEAADDPDPVPPEVDQQRDRGGHVHAHDEGQVRGLGPGHVQVAGPAPPDQRRDQHVVPQAGHGEELGHALDQADHASLEVRQMGHADLSIPGDPAACLTLFDLPSTPAAAQIKVSVKKAGAAPASGRGRPGQISRCPGRPACSSRTANKVF